MSAQAPRRWWFRWKDHPEASPISLLLHPGETAEQAARRVFATMGDRLVPLRRDLTRW